MTIKTGLAAQVMTVQESAWGVPTAVTRGLPILSESLKADRKRLESKAIYSGARFLKSQQWAPGSHLVAGDINLEVTDRTIGLLLTNMFGSVATSGPVNGIYTHTFTPGDLTAKGLGVQVGRPGTAAGTVIPYNYTGLKIGSWELACKADELATMQLSCVGRKEYGVRTVTDGATTSGQNTVTSATAAWTQDDIGTPVSGTGIPVPSYIGDITSATVATLSSSAVANTTVNASATGSALTVVIGTALATASYTAGIAPMTFVGSSMTLAGSAFRVNDLTLSCQNMLQDDRLFLGDQFRDEPLENDLRNYGGTINTEHFDRTAYDRFVNGTEAAMVFTIRKGLARLDTTMNVRFDGDTPTVGDRAVVKQSLPYVCVASGADSTAISAAYQTTDATP